MPPTAEHGVDPDRAALSLRAGGLNLDGRWLWRGLDVTLDHGECLGVEGPAGTGKTMLLRRLAALDALDEGEIRSDGRALADWNLPEFRARVGYVAQRPTLLQADVASELALPFSLRVRAGSALDEARAHALLEALGRDTGFSTRRCADLSGGERQIVALARTLLANPEIVLLDEPTASLDQDSSAAVEGAIRAWLDADARRAALWVGHDPDQLARIAARVLDLGAAPAPAPPADGGA